MMYFQSLLLALLTIFEVGLSLPVEEKIDPVDLKYFCIKVETDKEEQNKSPILLIHGIGGNHKNWDGVNQVLALRTQRRVCAVDLRNHGDSPWSNRSDIAALVVDVVHFLDEQNIKKVNVIGQSLGGKAAVHLTLTNPDRIDSVVVEDMRPNGITPEAHNYVQTFFEFIKAAAASIPEGVDEDGARKSIVDFINKKLEELGLPDRLDETLAKSIELRSVDGKWDFKYNMKVLGEAVKDPENILTKSSGEYTGPALFIYGSNSPFKVGEDKENILKLFPKAELLPVEGAGHIIHGKFREFDDAVIRFLNNVN